MNPCRCGFYGDATRECRFTPGQIQQYLRKISGPLVVPVKADRYALAFRHVLP